MRDKGVGALTTIAAPAAVTMAKMQQCCLICLERCVCVCLYVSLHVRTNDVRVCVQYSTAKFFPVFAEKNILVVEFALFEP